MKTVKGLLTGLCLAVILAGPALALDQIIPLDPASSRVELLAQDANSLRFRVEVGELQTLDVQTPEGPFTRLIVPGFHHSKIEGAPELPMLNRLVEIPYGAAVRVEILETRSRSIDLDALGVTHRLMPAQPSMPKNADPATWPFVYDPDAYRAEPVAQELARVVDQGSLRAVRIGRLEVSPVEYYPSENRLRVVESVEFAVVFEGGDAARESELKAATWSPFFEGVHHQIAGLRTPHEDHPDLFGNVVTMVVVAPPMFESTLADYVAWKTERGFNTILAITGTPEVGTTSTSIQAYIHGLYNDATPENPAPSFLVFVGDIAEVPTFTLGGDASDRPYACVDADLIPDMYYGRLSATNTTMLQNILDKTLMVDQFTMPNPAYLGEVVMIAGYDTGHGSTHGNGQINYGTSLYFNAAHGITSHTYLYPESGSSSSQIVQNVSDGVSYINYTAHGSTTSWSNPSFTQSNINNLQNDGEYCLAVGNCCLTSSYEIGECFGETWLRAANKGAIGYIGASNSTYWDEDYWWGIGHGPVSANPTYEQTGLGAYDGLFHDHGEAMDQWYVVNDALVFAGNLAVVESGSSRIEYYWNIYNLLGDPSLATFMGVPATNPVVHLPTIFTTSPGLAVEAVPNSYCGLTRDGEILAAGTVDETGSAFLAFDGVLTPGPVQLVVMAQNREPYVASLNVIVPATILIDPPAIDAGVTTTVSVGVFESDGVTPKPGIHVWAEGLDYATAHAVTGSDGYTSLEVTYPYGPSLDIVGQDMADPWELFREALTVNADPIAGIQMHVATAIGLQDTFALNLPGTLFAQNFGPGHGELPEHVLWAFVNDEPGLSTTADSLALTPADAGGVRGVFAVEGCDLIETTFPIIEAYGTLTGTVDAGGAPAVGAVVEGYDASMELAFTAVVDAAGSFDVGEDVLVAPYTLMVDYFGYLHYEAPLFVNYGPNTYDIVLDAAPAGVLTGTITELGTGDPLDATVKVYRSDTMDLYDEVATDPITGEYTTGSLPYFDYTVVVRAWHHIPVTIGITIEEPVVVKDFVLETTIGDLLVLDDTAKGGARPAKIEKGVQLAPAYEDGGAKAVDALVADLEYLGYTATVESASTTDPATWANYDMLICSSGSNTSPLGSAILRNALVAFVTDGGHLLIEGGEVGYDHYGDDNFAETVLHISDWDHDSSGDVTVAEPGHYVMSVPNTITGPIAVDYVGYGDADAVDATADAVKVGSWTSYADNASIVAYDPNPAPQGGQIVFYAFNYAAMDAAVRPQLLQNTVTWLMTLEVGDCSVSGTVTLQGETDHSGVLVQAIPGGGSVLTNAAGDYTLPGLFAGPYQIRASKTDWSIGVQEVVLGESEQMTGVDFLLTPVYVDTWCSQPGSYIGDYQTVSDVITAEGNAAISAVEVFVDITHTFQGDLTVDLTSPAGTTVRLHDRTGGGTDNIYGWYPGDMEPAENLDVLIGEAMAGDWTLAVEDHAGGDQGTLNEWCVRLTHAAITGIDDGQAGLPERLALGRNFPNPFNPKTTLRFDLPHAAAVELAVFDVGGRRVATLHAGLMEPGRHEVEWLGRADDGRALASGLYFARLRAEGTVLTRKMVLIK